MERTNQNCTGCGKEEWFGSADVGLEESLCICEHKRLKCDYCKHLFLKKDMSLVNMYLALCKCCNDSVPHLLDNMAVGFFDRTSDRAHTAMCVETFDDKLQLTIRCYHLGISVIFPAMTKKELVTHWLNDGPFWISSDIRLLFDAAILRLIPRYLPRQELSLLRLSWIEERKEAACAGLPLTSCKTF
jgi:hypothetical protein